MRQVSHADAPGVARLIHEIWSDHNPNPDRIARVSLETNHTTVIAEADNTVIGFVDGFTTISRDGVLRWEIDLLGVHPDHRGRGVAQALIAASVEAGRQTGATQTRALVQIDNAASLTAFRRCGFAPDEAIRELFVSGENRQDRPIAPPGAHLISVTTLTYSGVWVEGRLSFQALRCAQAARTRFGWDVAGAVIPEGMVAAQQAGYDGVGRYRWLRQVL